MALRVACLCRKGIWYKVSGDLTKVMECLLVIAIIRYSKSNKEDTYEQLRTWNLVDLMRTSC